MRAALLFGLAVASAAAAQTGAGRVGATFDRYCTGCHSERQQQAGLVLENADLAAVGARANTWEKVAAKLRARAMPPVGRPR
ncbi:MAG: c-type cytochrome domain-containing protein, partial [Acidobacteriota bacterium]|nr:c-type cytochrome domain-containing protein [Acidobacteriota bacterium]